MTNETAFSVISGKEDNLAKSTEIFYLTFLPKFRDFRLNVSLDFLDFLATFLGNFHAISVGLERFGNFWSNGKRRQVLSLNPTKSNFYSC